MNMHGDYIMILSDLIGCYIKRGGAPDRLQSWLATSATGIYIHIYIIVYGFLKPIRELNQKMQSHNQKHILLVKHISSRLRDLIPSPPTSINGCIFDFPSIHVCLPKWPKCIKQTQENCAGNHIYPTFVNIPACAQKNIAQATIYNISDTFLLHIKAECQASKQEHDKTGLLPQPTTSNFLGIKSGKPPFLMAKPP